VKLNTDLKTARIVIRRVFGSWVSGSMTVTHYSYDPPKIGDPFNPYNTLTRCRLWFDVQIVKTLAYPVVCPFTLYAALCDHKSQSESINVTDRQTDVMLVAARRANRNEYVCLCKHRKRNDSLKWRLIASVRQLLESSLFRIQYIRHASVVTRIASSRQDFR